MSTSILGSGSTPVTALPPPAAEPLATAQTVAMLNLFGDLHDDLAEATDEAELIAAVARYAAFNKAQALRLFYIDYDEHQVPVTADLVGSWQPDGSRLPQGVPLRWPVARFALLQLALRDPNVIHVIADIAAAPELSDSDKQLFARVGYKALCILPCFSRSSRTWQGFVLIYWSELRTPSPEELFVYNLTARMTTAFIANRRARLAHEQMLHELQMVNEVSVQLNAAQSVEQALFAVVTPFIERGAASALWTSVFTGPDGQPTEIEVIASWQRAPSPVPSLVGQRFPVTVAPLWRHWVADPDNPLLVGDINTDERFDAEGRRLTLGRQREALVTLPLRTRGRWVGAITISWTAPQVFTSRDHALCKSLANQAAVVFDNRLLMDRMQETAREYQRQSLALKTMLDNMPVGVMMFDATTKKPLMINPKAVEILGRSIDTAAQVETIGDHYKRYAAGTDRLMASDELPLARTLADGLPHYLPIELVRPDEQRLALDVFSAPIVDESGVMSGAMSLFVDVSERKRAEAESRRIQEEMIAFQAAALAERSTPLIPISDEILVLPLIGSLDTDRGHQVMDTLLHGVSQSGTRVAIIDVTGVRTLDTQAAQTLTQAAQALRLLGVEPVLTGIRAEVAQTLVSLGVPLNGIVTRSTLQSGIAYANRKKSR